MINGFVTLILVSIHLLISDLDHFFKDLDATRVEKTSKDSSASEDEIIDSALCVPAKWEMSSP